MYFALRWRKRFSIGRCTNSQSRTSRIERNEAAFGLLFSRLNLCVKIENQSLGSDGFSWWVGVVEDRRNDPLKLGRLRVRVLGAHTEDKTLIPTEDLFWFSTYKPVTSAATNGIGVSPTAGVVEGEWVFGYWLNEGKQDGVVFGVLSGIPQIAAQSNLGFNDPGSPYHDLPNAPRFISSRYYPNDGTGAQLQNESSAKTFPRQSAPWQNAVGEADTHRLARGENIDDTVVGVRKRQRDVNVPIAPATPSPSRQWNELESIAAPVYPYNKVICTESGHLIELDDTPNAERIHVYHRSGTFIEIQGGLEGDFVMKCVGKRFEVMMENAYSHYQNTLNVTVDGETNIYCRSNANLQIDGDLNLSVGGNVNEKVKGNYTTDIGGNRIVRVKGDDDLSVGGNHSMRAGGSEFQSAEGSLEQAAGGSIQQSAGGHFSMTGSSISADGSAINLNSGSSSSTNPQSPDQASIPAFPSPLNRWTESINQSGSDPQPESKPN